MELAVLLLGTALAGLGLAVETALRWRNRR